MGETIHLFLRANGTEIQGESTQTSLGRQNSIECYEFSHQVQVVSSTSGRISTRKRQYQPLMIRKRIDKSSPLLAKLMAENAILEGEFRFFRPNPTGDGTIEQYYSIRFRQGRIAGIHIRQADLSLEANSLAQPMEEVMISFNTISWTYTNGGVTYEDTSGSR
jgi:type VI secretion system secreted protein Hcp